MGNDLLTILQLDRLLLGSVHCAREKEGNLLLLSNSELLHVAFWNNRWSITDFPGLVPHVKVALGNILVSVFL